MAAQVGQGDVALVDVQHGAAHLIRYRKITQIARYDFGAMLVVDSYRTFAGAGQQRVRLTPGCVVADGQAD